jgi:nucleotide-binding universal stress UspA family protein
MRNARRSMKILLPIDQSSYSQEALRFIIKQLQPRSTQVRVLHVIEPITAFLTPSMIPQLAEPDDHLTMNRSREARQMVARAARTLRQAGFRTTEAIETGDPKTTIIDHAAKWRAELIVLGSYGLRGLSRFLMGSISDAVVRHADCSVQVVRSRKRRTRVKRPSTASIPAE